MRGLALLACALGFACASSGTSAPTLTPAEADLLYARYSGAWTLIEERSDPGSAALETEASSTRRGDPTDRPQIDSRLIRPTYQRAGQANAAIAGQMDRTAMRQTILIAGERPDALHIQLTAAGMEVTYDDRDPWVLPAEGGRIEVQENLGTVKVRLQWEEGIPIIEREIDKAGVVREVLQASPDGRALWLTRQVVMGTEAWQPATFAFRR